MHAHVCDCHGTATASTATVPQWYRNGTATVPHRYRDVAVPMRYRCGNDAVPLRYLPLHPTAHVETFLCVPRLNQVPCRYLTVPCGTGTVLARYHARTATRYARTAILKYLGFSPAKSAQRARIAANVIRGHNTCGEKQVGYHMCRLTGRCGHLGCASLNQETRDLPHCFAL